MISRDGLVMKEGAVMKRNLFFSGMLIVILALGFVACDSSGDNGDVNVVGFWDSHVIDEGISGTFTIQFRADGTYEVTVLFEGQTIPMGHGTYTVDGNTINFVMQDSRTTEATVSNNRFSVAEMFGDEEGYMTITFTRR